MNTATKRTRRCWRKKLSRSERKPAQNELGQGTREKRTPTPTGRTWNPMERCRWSMRSICGLAPGRPRLRRVSEITPRRSKRFLGRKARVLAPSQGRGGLFHVSHRQAKAAAARRRLRAWPSTIPKTLHAAWSSSTPATKRHADFTPGRRWAMHCMPSTSTTWPSRSTCRLSGQWETWSLLFRLHDRFPRKGLLRGSKPRTLATRRWFRRDDRAVLRRKHADVAGCRGQSHPALRGRRSRQTCTAAARFRREGLPRRHLFWREEMADGIIDRKTEQPGIEQPDRLVS